MEKFDLDAGLTLLDGSQFCPPAWVAGQKPVFSLLYQGVRRLLGNNQADRLKRLRTATPQKVFDFAMAV
ncbi:MAG: hypothetical protein CMJ81_17215 [Planctomycetaceae bacterium]|nr:hypothetical protein [Planctomycetaceae bacterium]